MPQPVLVYKLLLSSPRGIQEDRDAVRRAVEEVNSVLRSDGIAVEIRDWESDVRPSIGLDGQDVVNTQIVDGVDIAVVLIQNRIGGATPRAPSGTVEEARIVIARRERGENVDLMVFFKSPKVDLSEDALDELKKVLEFRNELESKGVFWKGYDAAADIERLVRTHLPNAIRSLHAGGPDQPLRAIVDAAASKELEEDQIEEDGALDLEIQFSDAIGDYTSCLERLTTNSEKLTEAFDLHTKEITAIGARESRDPKEARRAINRSVDTIKSFNFGIEKDFPVLKATGDVLTDVLPKLIGMSGQEVAALPNDMEALAQLIGDLASRSIASAGSVRDLRDTFSNLPRMTRELNEAKRRGVALMDDLADWMDSFGQRLIDAQEAALVRARQLRK